MDKTSSSSSTDRSVATQGASHITTSVDHPRLLRMDAESIRIFLRLYDQYSNEVTARAQQLTAVGSTSTEPIRPVNLKFCVDPEYIESAIALDLIPGATDYDTLTDLVLREYLENNSQESKESVTLETLDGLVEHDLRMDMTDKNARSRMQSLFVAYHKLLRRNGLGWLLEENQKVAVVHVLSAVKPRPLRDRLQSDLEFSHHALKKDFRKFMAHAIKISEAFKMVDVGPQSSNNRKGRDKAKNNRSGNKDSGTDTTPTGSSGTTSGSVRNKSKRSAPDCPFRTCKGKGLKHRIKDCPESTAEQKMFDDIAAAKAKDGPARYTRGQKRSETSSPSETAKGISKAAGTTGRLVPTQGTNLVSQEAPACPITVSDGRFSLNGTGRCDDGSDDSLVSPTLAEKAAIQGIGKINAIKPVRLQVALKSGNDAQSFTFSRTWTAPRTVLHLASGQLALANVTFLVADAELSCEDLLIGLPVLRHLQIDTRTLLENNRAVLDGADCSTVGNPTVLNRGGNVSRMMIARLHQIRQEDTPFGSTPLSADRPRVNYNVARADEDPFPDPSLLDPLDADQHEEINSAVASMQRNCGRQWPSARAPQGFGQTSP